MGIAVTLCLFPFYCLHKHFTFSRTDWEALRWQIYQFKYLVKGSFAMILLLTVRVKCWLTEFDVSSQVSLFILIQVRSPLLIFPW